MLADAINKPEITRSLIFFSIIIVGRIFVGDIDFLLVNCYSIAKVHIILYIQGILLIV